MPAGFNLTPPGPLSITSLVINLLIGAVIGVVLAWHFRRFGHTMSNRSALAQVFPLIILTTILVISVVKASLALSLGLVGALSIVRFRTPIKEPEELAYLFMAIGVGLSLGADHRIATVAASVVILGLLAGRHWAMRPKRDHNLYLNVEVQGGTANGTLDKLTDLLNQNTRVADARRLDVKDGLLQATFFIDCEDDQQLFTVMNKLKESLPEASITFVDQGHSLAG